jgi:hypothetical protein
MRYTKYVENELGSIEVFSTIQPEVNSITGEEYVYKKISIFYACDHMTVEITRAMYNYPGRKFPENKRLATVEFRITLHDTGKTHYYDGHSLIAVKRHLMTQIEYYNSKRGL